MKTNIKITAAAAVAALLAAPVVAQTTVTGVRAINDRIVDIESDVQTDISRGDDTERFGPLGVPQGWRGSLALSTSATDGNTEERELSAGARLTYGVGKWAHTFGVAAEYGRSAGVLTSQDMFVSYEANRYFTEGFYMFGIGRYQYDGIGGTEHEGFLGFGPGWRVVNTPQTTWRVQAGPGALYTKTSLGVDNTEFAGIVSSRFYHSFSDTLALTNDTDVMVSKLTTIASNDLGLNVKMTDTLSTRLSLRSDYDDSRAIKTDNKLGVSLVLGF